MSPIGPCGPRGVSVNTQQERHQREVAHGQKTPLTSPGGPHRDATRKFTYTRQCRHSHTSHDSQASGAARPRPSPRARAMWSPGQHSHKTQRSATQRKSNRNVTEPAGAGGPWGWASAAAALVDRAGCAGSPPCGAAPPCSRGSAPPAASAPPPAKPPPIEGARFDARRVPRPKVAAHHRYPIDATSSGRPVRHPVRGTARRRRR